MSPSTRSIAVALSALAVATACGSNDVTDPSGTHAAPPPAASLTAGIKGAVLATARSATAQYHRIEVATAEGYTFVAPCHYSAAGLGGRGAIRRNPAITDGVLDASRPEILFYEPQADGSMRLVGIGFIVLAAPWDAAHAQPPTLEGQPFIDRRVVVPGGPPPHYALWVSLWRHNPAGMFAPFNPNVSCEFATSAIAE
jgi:hypothetical protein